LGEKTGELDLLQLLAEYNKILLEDYGKYIGNYFVGSLIPIHEFAARLTKEIKSVKPEYQLLICTEAQRRWSKESAIQMFDSSRKCFALFEYRVEAKTSV
jgi:hypothetical protein